MIQYLQDSAYKHELVKIIRKTESLNIKEFAILLQAFEIDDAIGSILFINIETIRSANVLISTESLSGDIYYFKFLFYY